MPLSAVVKPVAVCFFGLGWTIQLEHARPWSRVEGCNPQNMFNTHACKQSFAQLINCVLIHTGPNRGPRHILTFRFKLDHELGMISGKFHRAQSTGTSGIHVSIVVMAFCSEAQDVGRRWRCCERDTYRMVGVTFVDAV